MKIALFTWRDIENPRAGGSELYFHEIAKRWVEKGHNVYWVSSMFGGAKSFEIIDGVEIYRGGDQWSVYTSAAIIYHKILKHKGVDVILDTENGIPFFTPFFSHVPKILHIHHIHKEVWFKELPKYLAHIGCFLEMKVMPIFYRKAAIMTLSKSSAIEIQKELFPKSKPVIVPPGIDFYKRKKFTKTKNPTILFLNRIKKYKGVEVLLDAAPELLTKKHDLKIIIAGTGDDLERMKNYAKEKKLHNVDFLGKISQDKKQELMASSWLFINPSLKEGWGIVNIEANYAGTPVIGSNVGGIRDSVSEGKSGLLFEYGDSKELTKKILYLVNNKNKLKSLSKSAQTWARRFDWDSAANRYLDVLKDVARKN